MSFSLKEIFKKLGFFKPNPLVLSSEEMRRYKFFSSRNSTEIVAEYFNVAALCYSCATANLPAIQSLLIHKKVDPNGCSGFVNRPLYSAIDNLTTAEDQINVVRMIEAHGASLTAWDLDKHVSNMKRELWNFIYEEEDPFPTPAVEDIELTAVQINVLALSYVCLEGMKAEAEYLLRKRKVSPYGCEGVEDEPIKAALKERSGEIVRLLQSHGVKFREGITLTLNDRMPS